MRLAVISDIHGNLEAFRAVLEDIREVGVDSVVSLGDNIGYGADPEPVMNLLRRHGIESVLGNHELALMDPSCRRSFHPFAKKALAVNQERLSRKSLDDIHRMPACRVRDDLRFVHGCPPDSVTTYIIHEPPAVIAAIMKKLPQPIVFVGHTHYLDLYELENGSVKMRDVSKWGVALDQNSRYIVNTGSVGQPRKGEILATYVIWDSAERVLVPRFIEFDNRTAAAKIIEAGIPEGVANRLKPRTGGR